MNYSAVSSLFLKDDNLVITFNITKIAAATIKKSTIVWINNPYTQANTKLYFLALLRSISLFLSKNIVLKKHKIW